ncbi:MAG: hypothetical protein LC734_06125 [Acidobacteria bacterium]|nr:hypothetical protein [Acidobacteriota bacterium]
MTESRDPKDTEKPLVRCDECDRETEHYNQFLGPNDAMRNVCWECTSRAEKGFFAKRDFRRGSRSGYIPR